MKTSVSVHLWPTGSQETVEPSQWRYVNSKDNPAEDASRGRVREFLKDIWWIEGPASLWLQEEHTKDLNRLCLNRSNEKSQ